MSDSKVLERVAGFYFVCRLVVFLNSVRVVREAPVFSELPTEELADEAARHIRKFHTLGQAAALMGYPESVFVGWYNAGERRRGKDEPLPELVAWHDAIAWAFAKAIGELLKDLSHAGYETKKGVRKIDVRATQALLAALDPERFDPRNVNTRLLRDSMEGFIVALEDVMGADLFETVALAVQQVAGDTIEAI